jgi:hypothetical protein
VTGTILYDKHKFLGRTKSKSKLHCD